jgi:signal transduction histidine kinase
MSNEGVTPAHIHEAVDHAQLVQELRASRARIVTTADLERLRLERDLHDGAQQRLMAVQIKLALLRERIDEPNLRSEVDEIAEDTAAAVAELRGLADGIYPTVLHERGLRDALRSLARTSSLPIDVTDDEIGRFASVVETAIYFCAAEAIENAAKHAGPDARVAVTLQRRADAVLFAVADDGTGFDAATISSGSGLVEMRDRLDAVGGAVEIATAPGRGTVVRGRAPASPSVVTVG